jgi:Ca-activated chloride channel family protein
VTARSDFTVRADRRLIRAGARSDRYVLGRVHAPLASRSTARSPVDVAFVLDRSGSMSGGKIRLAKEALRKALQGLDERDRFAVVVYDDRIDVVVESTPGSPEAKRNALDRLDQIDARGSTNLAEGWLRGAEQIAQHQRQDVVSRVLLLTDGLANVGITSAAELELHARELRRRGIATTTFGVGADFDEALLQSMAVAGGGHFYFIERAAQIPDYLTSELGEVLEIVARDVVIEVGAAEGVMVQPLSAVPVEGSGQRVRLLLGDLVSGQELDTVIQLNFPRGEIGHRVVAAFQLADREGVLRSAPLNLIWEYADNAAVDTQPRDRSVDRLVAELYAARARQEAVMLNARGDFGRAADVLRKVANRVRDYAGDDPELNRTLQTLAEEGPQFAAPMPAMERKRHHFVSGALAMMRTPEGKAKRRPEK